MSFSRRSGIAGTEGWIAPEMMLGNRSTTCAVDVFSLGCVYYFVLTNGSHPFGESFRRQANILTGEYDLSKLSDEKWSTSKALIEKMISVEHTHRPTTLAILKHPMFWPTDKTLNFLQDVSDRVDKESFDSAILASIERNRLDIVRNNWYDYLDVQVNYFFTFISFL
jgi:serine/threonine-protein kinase/endoribonuclease IRE1